MPVQTVAPYQHQQSFTGRISGEIFQGRAPSGLDIESQPQGGIMTAGTPSFVVGVPVSHLRSTLNQPSPRPRTPNPVGQAMRQLGRAVASCARNTVENVQSECSLHAEAYTAAAVSTGFAMGVLGLGAAFASINFAFTGQQKLFVGLLAGGLSGMAAGIGLMVGAVQTHDNCCC